MGQLAIEKLLIIRFKRYVCKTAFHDQKDYRETFTATHDVPLVGRARVARCAHLYVLRIIPTGGKMII